MIAPPRIAAALLHIALPRDVRGATIAGDLLQEYEELLQTWSPLRARAWYWFQALALSGRYVMFRAANAWRARRSRRTPTVDPEALEIRALSREEAMENFWTDLRYGVRMLFRTPTLSSISIFTIGLGIGLVTFTFSVVYGAVLRPLPVQAPERFIALSANEPAEGFFGMSLPMADFVAMRDQSTAFEALAGQSNGTINIAGYEGEAPQRFEGAFMTANGLDIIGVPPHLGRTFQPGEDLPGAEATVILGYDVWRNHFGADESIVGTTVRANGESATIIGVMPPGFRFPFDHEIWMTTRTAWEGLPRRDGNSFVQVYGYLREGVTLEAANEEASMIADRLAAEFPDTNEGLGADVQAYDERYMPTEITQILWMMLGATVGVMLIACANVANLLLARAALRTRDVAVRTALGANRLRVMRQLLTEAMVLGVLGGVTGVVLALVSTYYFNIAVASIQKPYWIDMRVDVTTLLFSAGVTMLAAMAAGTLPAMRASGADVGGVLRDETRGSSGLRIGRLTGALVVGELAVSCVLLIAAGFMVQSILNTQTMELGFEPDKLMTARVGLFLTEYPERADRQRFFRDLEDRLNDQGGIQKAALTTYLPAAGAARWRFAIEGEAYEVDGDLPRTFAAQVTAGYFDTMGSGIVSGRDFRRNESFWDPETSEDVEPVLIVNESFAARFFPQQDPLGARIRLGTLTSENPWMRIVGVVPDQFVGGGVGGIGSDQQPPEQVYFPLGQMFDVRFASMVMRGTGSTEGIANIARETVASIDPNLPIYFVVPMTQVLTDNSWAISLFGSLFTIFGVAALFLASVGLYGVVSFAVAQRRQEMGVRMALGAERGDILRVVFRRVALQLALGLGIGVAIAYAVSGPLRFVMFGVETTNVSVYAAVVVTLVATAMIATFVPAHRAATVDPVTALRPE